MDQPQPINAPAAWLEVVDGAAPILLIAPHGGRAGAAARATLHPKVNDLETAAITRELASRIGASALINAAMDRNELDCNRLSQLAGRAPWLLDLIADRVAAMVERHGHATVLLIHGWNVIEPRVDLGLGLRERSGRLHPPAGAHISACDAFIHGPVTTLTRRLQSAGIIPSFGLRYPGGARQNLLQAFTQRHSDSPLDSLQRLADYAARGVIDALQLEMSIAVRLAGELRMRNLDVLSEVFAALPQGLAPGAKPKTPAGNTIALDGGNGATAHDDAPIPVVRTAPPPRAAAKAKPVLADTPQDPPTRVGIEFFDPVAGIGALVSFDFGANAAGARIMVLFDGHRAALFTGAGDPARDGLRIRLGPLELDAGANRSLNFRGTAVIVNNGAAYLSVERALAEGNLDGTMEVSATLHFPDDCGAWSGHLARILAPASAEEPRSIPAAAYGRLDGSVVIEGHRRPLNAVARMGFSFTGLSPQKFLTRRMLWVSFPAEQPSALEARLVRFDDEDDYRCASLLIGDSWNQCELAAIDLDTPGTGACPDRVDASFIDSRNGTRQELAGDARSYMTLSRPGFGNARIHTTLGFATYRLGNRDGAGMFEYSRIADAAGAAADDSDDGSE
ncbi:MAG: hypothetical protein ABSG46_02330 [Candidatus Binataceae bacterium]|jgi:hypothetical protein